MSSQDSPLWMGPNDGPYPITGITKYLVDGEEIPMRREVDEWYASEEGKDELQVYIFLRAMQNFQKEPEDNMLSYFQIAGIHGLPWTPWLDGSEAPKNPKQKKNYCTHNTILFPTWHRPYLLCFEQLVFAHMENVIKVGQQNGEWDAEKTEMLLDAIKTWRLPFWDQGLLRKDPGDAERKYHFPKICADEFIKIPGLLPPSGSLPQIGSGASPEGQDRLRNPMYKFTFPSGKNMSELNCDYRGENQDDGTPVEFGPTKGTSRWASSVTGETWVQGQNNYQNVVGDLEKHDWYENYGDDGPLPVERQYQKTLAETMSRLILPGYLDEYETYSSAQFLDQSKPIENLSIEDVHNNMHGWIGGNGHMSNVPTSAFDPIFWLHHANYDRLLALWQQTHPKQWIKSTYNGDKKYEYVAGNWSIPMHTVVDGTTPLMPFFRLVEGRHVAFNSFDVEDFAQYGYTYPLIDRQWQVPYDENKREEDIKKITKAVNNAYGTVRQTIIKHAERAGPERGRAIRGLTDIDQNLEGNIAGNVSDYVVNVVFDRYANRGSGYIVHILLGQSSERNGKINLQGSTIPAGTVIALGNGLQPTVEGEGGCENCAKQKAGKILSAGQVLLSKSILDNIVSDDDNYPEIDRLNKVEEIKDYLTENLHWKVTDFTGRILDTSGEDFKDLRISVAIGTMTFYEEKTRHPTFANYDVFTNITEHKPAGLRAVEAASYYSV
ncbi:hypothetical protein TWF730_004340 [Orbilia blumenaviensis]|uniref:tyrosinase n=1 Tax=Orbilia blumenaviensis TaxID=1796055 RepID=A0AAV9U1M6_9PEZI